MLLERTRSSRSEGLRALACVRGSSYCSSCSSSCCCCFTTWVFVVECVFSSASSVERGFWLCFVEGGFFFPFGLG